MNDRSVVINGIVSCTTYFHLWLAFVIMIEWENTPLWWSYELLRSTEVHARHGGIFIC